MIQVLGTWADSAACKGRIGLFFPANRAENERSKVSRALAICNTCAVLEHCRTYALGANERFGIWGGLTPEQLSTERRTLGITAPND